MTTQPINNPQTCTVSPQSITVNGSAISDVAVNCQDNRWQASTPTPAGVGTNRPRAAIGIDGGGDALVAYYASRSGGTAMYSRQPAGGAWGMEYQLGATIPAGASPDIKLTMNGAGQAFVTISGMGCSSQDCLRWIFLEQASATPLSGTTSSLFLSNGPVAAGLDNAGYVTLTGLSRYSTFYFLRLAGAWFNDPSEITPSYYASGFQCAINDPALVLDTSVSPAGRAALVCAGSNMNPMVATSDGSTWTNATTTVLPGAPLVTIDNARIVTNDSGVVLLGYDETNISRGRGPHYQYYNPANNTNNPISGGMGTSGTTSRAYDVALDAAGNALIAWYDNSGSGAHPRMLCYQRISNTGSAAPEKCVSTDNTGSAAAGITVILAINQAGVGYVGLEEFKATANGSWQPYVYLQAIDTLGRIDLPPTIANRGVLPTGTNAYLSLAVNASGQGAAAWGMLDGSTQNWQVHVETLR